jgi:2-oxoisovalerate dehydrogenase E1 component
MLEAAQHLRAGKGPVLLHAMVIRPYGHSMSDDEQSYKPPREREEEAKRDPIMTYPKYLISEGLATQEAIEQIQKDVDAEIAEAEAAALKAAKPKAESIYDHLYSPTVDPTSSAFEVEPRFEGQPETMVTLINRCLKDEMARDPRIVLFGEDVADATREGNLEAVPGKGGVFKVTYGL